MKYNEFNQPVGESLCDFNMPEFPNIQNLTGQYSKLEKLETKHIDDLFNHFSMPEDLPNWTYLPDEQPQNYKQFQAYIEQKMASQDPYFFAVVDKQNNEAIGILSLLRINPKNASIEVGHIHFSNKLKRSRIATEVHFLLAEYVFETLGYRRYEWKCDSLNQPSIKAAQRLGFKYEGTFRNHVIYKNRNRNTVWLSMLSEDWPTLKMIFEDWLVKTNFDSEGNQLKRLSV
ncbi:GNAT family N-acetyltransferase [Staphylococcus sp. ACRSN]|uniref:GNAT family N-acetyltransferase n=1 Tax=Staphylococcus sp. ACRSN TaxID=2918214 RepID=UPI001EF1D373|nr:GNAT family protein [Staphylococcus sp. ACRSN]MCG7338684.1 GNAT family N-acetyltransferase [Staphylococcus sp. ACRSN]